VHSSTSSFKAAFVLCLIFLGIYSISIKFVPFEIHTGQGQADENKIKLENYLFEDQRCQFIFVGSSLSYRLEKDDLGPDFCNLSFGGGSALSGIEVVLKYPKQFLKKVYVEINVLRDIDDNLLESVEGSYFWIKEFVPALQNRYRPINVALNYLQTKFPQASYNPSPEQFKLLFAIQKREVSDMNEIFISELKKNVVTLKRQVRELEAKNIKVVLVEVPMDPLMLKSPRMEFIRSQFLENFPRLKIWSSGESFDTVDGIHLDLASAARFAKIVRGFDQ
jgi:hypothetical protein